MSKEKTKISIVILTWNGLNDTLEVLKDIEKLEIDGMSAETIVVDNGSTDGTQQKLRNHKLKNMEFKLIETGVNLGFAGGNNVGIRDAYDRGSEYVIVMNNDIALPKDILLKLVSSAKKQDKLGLLAPKMYFAKGYEFHKDRYKKNALGKVIWYAGGKIDWDNIYSSHRGVDEVDKGQYDKEEETDYVNGACALITRDLIREIGFLDDKYFLYWEDADYSQRAKKAGFKVIYTPKTRMWHKVSKASGIGSELNDYFLTRNRLLFAKKYAGSRARFALLRESIKLIIVGRKWQKIGIRDFYLGRFGKGSWGKK